MPPSPGPAAGSPTALITGASAGLGAEFARQLAAKGYGLVLVARTESRLEELATALRAQHGVDVEVLPADLGDRDGLSRVADRVASTVRPLDLLVNNAGYGLATPFVDASVSDEETLLDVLVRAPMVLTHSAIQVMRARGRGRVINVSSVASFLASGTYSAAKSYITVFTESLAGQLQGTGVSATVVCPGYVRTEFHERAGMDRGARDGVMWLDAGETVAAALADAEAGRVVSIPSPQYKGLVLALRHLPRTLLRSGAVTRRHRRDEGD